MIPHLIENTKRLFEITHKKRGIISENRHALFDYDLNDLKLHKQIWGRYQKKLIKLLGYNFKTARKTYNTLATELEISETIRRILLGHSSVGVNEKHYTNRRTITLSEKVQQSHTEILEDFDFENLSMMLYFKMMNYLSDKENVIILRILDSDFKKLKVDKLNN